MKKTPAMFAALLLMLPLGLVAQEPSESEVEQRAEEAAQETEQAIENAAQETEEAVEEVASETEEFVEDAEGEIDQAVNDAENEIDEQFTDEDELPRTAGPLGAMALLAALAGGSALTLRKARK